MNPILAQQAATIMIENSKANGSANGNTRDRLLEAASRIFADKGYDDATIRQICQLAGANVAAVNYHFRDKEELYREVLLGAHKAVRERYPLNQGVTPQDPPEARLRAFVRGMLLRIFDDGEPPFGKLMARELISPTKALDGVVEQGPRPQFAMLTEIVRELLPPGVSEQDVRLCGGSVIGQMALHHSCRSVMERLFPGEWYGAAHIDVLVDQIVRFSLAALRNYGVPATTPVQPRGRTGVAS